MFKILLVIVIRCNLNAVRLLLLNNLPKSFKYGSKEESKKEGCA